MKVFLKDLGAIDLTKRHFVYEGGEGQVFDYKGRGIKIYKDPKTMIPTGKITELATIQDDHVIAPRAVVLDAKTKQPIGYEMPFLRDTISLARVVTKVFRERNGVTADKVLKMVRQMQAGVANIHTADILLVDINIMNFLVGEAAYDEVFFIDVDSYQTEHYPATALMRDVRDYTIQNNSWTELSDWFSFAVVTCYLWLGMHPYKGKHPDYQPRPSDQDKFLVTERRMRDHVSVFNSQVKVPGAAYPTTIIPGAYQDWYEAVLERGKRLLPPADVMRSVPLVHVARVVHSSGALNVTELDSLTDLIVDVFENQLVITNNAIQWNGRTFQRSQSGPLIAGVGLDGAPVVGALQRGQLQFANLVTGERDLTLPLVVTGVMAYAGRIYVQSAGSIYELEFHRAGGKTFVGTHEVARVLERATQLFPGVAIQNLLGATFVSLFPKPREHQQIRIEALDGYRVIDAKFDHNVLMVIGEKNGKFDRLRFRFAEEYRYHDEQIERDVPLAALNFVTLDSGVCVCLNEDGQLEAFSNQADARSVKVIEDKTLGSDIMLHKDGGKLLAARGQKIYQLSMK